MARFLALDGDAPLIQVLSANVKGDSVRLEQTLAVESGPVNAANASTIGAALRDQLRDAGISPAPLLVTVGRDRVVLKELRIPAVAEHEEPAIVRFQALKEFADGGEEMVLDYAPLGPVEANGRRVQVMSVRKDVLLAYRKLAEAAGLKLVAVTPRPFALLAGQSLAVRTGQVPDVEPSGAPVAVLVRGSKWGEFLIVRDGTLSLTRSIAGPALSSDTALLGELRRNLALYANQNPDQPVRALYLAEADTPGGLRERLQDSLAIPVHAYEPAIGVIGPDGPPGTLAGLAGLLALRGQRDPGINFVQPREPKPPRDPNKVLLGWGGAILALVTVVCFGIAFFRVQMRSSQVSALKQEATQAKNTVRDFEQDFNKVKALDEWAGTDVNWLDELYELTARMKDTNNVRLTQLVITPNESQSNARVGTPRNGKEQPKEVATITIRGQATENNAPLDRFMLELGRDSFYRVSPKTVKPARSRDGFRQEFSTKVEVRKRPPDAYTMTLNASPPPARRLKPSEPTVPNRGSRSNEVSNQNGSRERGTP